MTLKTLILIWIYWKSRDEKYKASFTLCLWYTTHCLCCVTTIFQLSRSLLRLVIQRSRVRSLGSKPTILILCICKLSTRFSNTALLEGAKIGSPVVQWFAVYTEHELKEPESIMFDSPSPEIATRVLGLLCIRLLFS